MEYIVKRFEKDPDKYKFLDVDNISIDDININSIVFDEGRIIARNDDSIKIVETDYEHPLVVVEGYLKINPDWYLNNFEKTNELINVIIKTLPKQKINIGDIGLINDKTIESLCENRNLEEVELAKWKSDKYSLSEKHYQMFKKSTIKKVETSKVDDELKENFDPLIDYNHKRVLICQIYNYEHILKKSPIIIDEKLIEEDLNNLKYLTDDNEIVLTEKVYSELPLIINRLKELNINSKITIRVNDKEKINKMIFENLIPEYEEIYISGKNNLSLKQYARFEKILYDMIEPAKDLSPFEKYIYAYNITKKYKPYKENEESRMEARNLYDILQNEYMVCVGFANMLEDLLNKLDIHSKYYGIVVDTSYDKNEDEIIEKPVTKGDHARLLVYLKDEKYGIDGYYISDPTWDNDMQKDLYNHMLMTPDEMVNSARYNWMSLKNADELFAVHSVEEFYKMTEFLLSRKKEGYTKNDLIELMKKMKQNTEIDLEFTKKIEEKYPDINNIKLESNIEDIVYDLATYVSVHTNKKISSEVMFAGIKNMYKKTSAFQDETLEQMMNHIIEENYKREAIQFPKRIKTFGDGREEIINDENKFDLETEIKTR